MGENFVWICINKATMYFLFLSWPHFSIILHECKFRASLHHFDYPMVLCNTFVFWFSIFKHQGANINVFFFWLDFIYKNYNMLDPDLFKGFRSEYPLEQLCNFCEGCLLRENCLLYSVLTKVITYHTLSE